MPSPEFAALDAYRLDHDWTWQQLANAMAKAECAVPYRTLHYLVKRAPRNAKPLDRTMHKIRKFLELIADEKKPRRRSRRASAQVTA